MKLLYFLSSKIVHLQDIKKNPKNKSLKLMFPRSTVDDGQALTAAPFLKVGNTSPQTQSISTLQAWWKVHGVSLLGSSV